MTSKNKTIKVTPKNILVTGGLGFIGYNVVVRLMNGGHKISIVDNKTTYGILPHLVVSIMLNDLLILVHRWCTVILQIM